MTLVKDALAYSVVEVGRCFNEGSPNSPITILFFGRNIICNMVRNTYLVI